MADRSTERRWLQQLTVLPTVPGAEGRVVAWVERWVSRRPDLTLRRDRGGNLLVGQKGRKQAPPVVAVAHLDHPGFVVVAVDGRELEAEFRGGMRPEYFAGARVEFFDSEDRSHRGRVASYDPEVKRGAVLLDRLSSLVPGDIGRFSFAANRGGVGERFALAPACDDLAGVAAALAALDRARGLPTLGHLGVLLTRAEEIGLVGAIGACREATLPEDARVLSIECSRAYEDSPLGGGPVIRVGDASTVFDHELTNRLVESARRRGIAFQRRLMGGGVCEATAFAAYGYRATGLCLPLGNYHNMGYLDEVERGKGMATPLPEVISLADFHGLVDLLLVAATAVDEPTRLRERLDQLYDEAAAVLE